VTTACMISMSLGHSSWPGAVLGGVTVIMTPPMITRCQCYPAVEGNLFLYVRRRFDGTVLLVDGNLVGLELLRVILSQRSSIGQRELSF